MLNGHRIVAGLTGLAALLLLLPAALAGSQAPARLACPKVETPIHIVVKNVQRQDGTITADLHGDRPADFLKKGKKILRKRVAAKDGETHLCLPAPRTGTFAVVLYHDINANRRLDRGFLGLPAEPFGLSNDPTLRLARPKHAESAFRVGAEGATIEITLRLLTEPPRAGGAATPSRDRR